MRAGNHCRDQRQLNVFIYPVRHRNGVGVCRLYVCMYVCMYVNVCMYACKTDITIYANWCSVRTGAMRDRIPLPLDVLVNGRIVKSIRINTCRFERGGRRNCIIYVYTYIYVCVAINDVLL